MGFNIGGGGGSKQKSRPSDASEVAAGMLLENFYPGISQTGASGLGEKTIGTYFGPQGYTGGSALGQTGTSMLPSIADISRYDTMGEKYDAGTIDSFSKGMMDRSMQLASTNFGGVTGGSAPQIMPSAGEFEVKGIKNIGEYTTEIMGSLPSEMQGFITNVFNNTNPDAIAGELDSFTNAMVAQGQADADSFGGQLLNQFSSMGLGTSGAAINAMKGVAVETAVKVNSQIAAARLDMLDKMINAQQIGVNLVNTLMDSGEAEQANRIQAKIAEIDAKARIMEANLQAQVQFQSNMAQVQAQLQTAQMGFVSDQMRILAGQLDQEEMARISGSKLPYDVLTGIATDMPATSSGSSSNPWQIGATFAKT